MSDSEYNLIDQTVPISECYLPKFNIGVQTHYHKLIVYTYRVSDMYFNSAWYFKLRCVYFTCNTTSNWYTRFVHDKIQVSVTIMLLKILLLNCFVFV